MKSHNNVEFIECKSYNTARRRALWASAIMKVEGGFLAFAYVTDYCVAKNQK